MPCSSQYLSVQVTLLKEKKCIIWIIGAVFLLFRSGNSHRFESPPVRTTAVICTDLGQMKISKFQTFSSLFHRKLFFLVAFRTSFASSISFKIEIIAKSTSLALLCTHPTIKHYLGEHRQINHRHYSWLKVHWRSRDGTWEEEICGESSDARRAKFLTPLINIYHNKLFYIHF